MELRGDGGRGCERGVMNECKKKKKSSVVALFYLRTGTYCWVRLALNLQSNQIRIVIGVLLLAYHSLPPLNERGV